MPKSKDVTADKKDEKELYKQLETELRKRKKTKEAIFQLMKITKNSRRTAINDIEGSGDITSTVLEKFPFLDQETAVSKHEDTIVYTLETMYICV